MATFTITPADSPDVQCDFVIPRSDGPLEFSVPRAEYSFDFDKKWVAWAEKRMEKVKQDDGTEVDAEPISDREAIIQQLRIAGDLSASVVKKIEKLTNGELDQIYQAWTDASKVTVGESVASDS